MAMGRLLPLLRETQSSSHPKHRQYPFSAIGPVTGTGPEADERRMQRLEQIVAVNNMEANRLLALDAVPFKAEEELGAQLRTQMNGGPNTRQPVANSFELLRCKVKEWMVNNTIRSEREVRDAVGKLIERRRKGDVVAVEHDPM